MPSINLDCDYFDHPKTVQLVRLLGKGAEVLPIRLWCDCGKYHYEDGRLTGYSKQEIEQRVRWWGSPGKCAAALVATGFLDVDSDGTFVVHNFINRCGHIAAFKERGRKGAKAKWDKARGLDPPKDASSNASSINTSNALTKHTSHTQQHVAVPIEDDFTLIVKKFIESHRHLGTWNKKDHTRCEEAVRLVGWDRVKMLIEEIRREVPPPRHPILACVLHRAKEEVSEKEACRPKPLTEARVFNV